MDSNNRRIVKNSIFLLSRTLFLTLVTFFTLREVIDILGPVEFGLYTVIFGLVAMFAFVNGALMASTQRYLAFEIGRGDLEEVRQTFYSAFIFHVIIALLLGGVIFIFKDYFINDVLKIEGYEKEASIVYNFSILSIVIALIQLPFSALITAYEKMQAFAYFSIFEGVSKLLAVYLLVFFDTSKVVLYSLLLCVISAFLLLLNCLYCFYNFPKVSNIISSFRQKKNIMLNGMIGFMGWSLIGNLSVVMRTHGSNILLNLFFGLTTNAAFSISMTVMGAISTLMSSVSNAINPQIFKRYAENKLDKFYSLMEKGTKYYMYFISILIIPIIFCMDYLVDLWLKDIPSSTLIFCKLAIVLVIIDSFSMLLISSIQATGNIKWNQITTGSILLMAVPISYIAFKMGLNDSYIYISAIFLSFVSIFFRLYFLKINTNYIIFNFIKKVLFPVLSFQILILFNSYFCYYYLDVSDAFGLFIYLFSCLLFNLIFLYILILNKNERLFLKNLKYKFFKKNG